MKGMRGKLTGGSGCHPGIHYVKPGEQVILQDGNGAEVPTVGMIAMTPQGIPILLVGDQVDKEMLLLLLLQRAMVERKQREESPLAKAGFVVPAGVSMPVREPDESDVKQ